MYCSVRSSGRRGRDHMVVGYFTNTTKRVDLIHKVNLIIMSLKINLFSP
jgi:hypothetical protein